MRRLFVSILVFVGVSVHAEASGIDVSKLETIQVAPDGGVLAQTRMLRRILVKELGLELKIVEAPYEIGRTNVILLGRELALASGMITADELEDVKFDGFIVKGEGGRIAVAGFNRLGTMYGLSALLRKLGVECYSGGRDMPVVYERKGDDAVIPAFTIAEKPFFPMRILTCGRDMGLFRTTRRGMGMGNPQKAANQDVFSKEAVRKRGERNYVCAGHTAAYLVPQEFHFEDHPEYYGMNAEDEGKRVRREIWNYVVLNLGNPAVHDIAAKRMREWMDIQKDERFFFAFDGDLRSDTSLESRALDRHPHYITDRYLSWVNSIAKGALEKYPENRVVAGAYIQTAKPPMSVGLEPNVTALYCPWWWDSCGTRVDDFAHPRNTTAMRELMDWNLRFPGQIGVYDYPGRPYLWLQGQEQRVKFNAKHNIRHMYFDAGPFMFNGLFFDVISKLLWDPFLDAAKLEEAYVNAYYGKAAPDILAYLKLHHKAAARTNGNLFIDEELTTKGLDLLKRALAVSDEDDDASSIRVKRDVIYWLGQYLIKLYRRMKAGEISAAMTADYKENLAFLVKEYGNYIAQVRALDKTSGVSVKFQENLLANTIFPSLGLKGMTEATSEDVEVLVKRSLATLDAKKRVDSKGAEHYRYVGNSDGECERGGDKKITPKAIKLFQCDPASWTVECSSADLTSEPRKTSLSRPSGNDLSGVAFSLPFNELPICELPIHPDGKNKLRAGTFLAKRSYSPAIDLEGCDYVDIRLNASRDVPMSVYLDMDNVAGIRGDVPLHAGEQIIRLDLNNHFTGEWGRFKEKWSGKVSAIGLDFWPQDNYYPYPEAKNAEVTILGIDARIYERLPSELPYVGKAIWLTQFRPNLRFEPKVDAKYLRKPRSSHFPERYRSWTPQRELTPVFAIQATKDDGNAAQILSVYLKKLFNVQLPVRITEAKAGTLPTNVMLVGEDACVAAGFVAAKELQYVGEQGFVINIVDGKMVISGNTPRGTLYGVSRYLQYLGARFPEPGKVEYVPNLRENFLLELYQLDFPWFKNREIPGGWKLYCQEPPMEEWETSGGDVDVTSMAKEIKELAREKKDATPRVLRMARTSPLHLYVAAQLLWDPFLDTSRLVAEFNEYDLDRSEHTKGLE